MNEWLLENGETIKIGDIVILRDSENLINSGVFGREYGQWFGNAVVKIVDSYNDFGQCFFVQMIKCSNSLREENEDKFLQIIRHQDWHIRIENIDCLFYKGYEPPVTPILCYCNYCGTIFTLSEEERKNLPKEDKNLCPNCRRRNMVLPYHQYKPELIFYKEKENDNDNLYLGIELEVDEGGENSLTVRDILPIMNKEEGKFFIYCGHDSSLNDGFEIITNPATPNYHREKEQDYAFLFKELVSRGYYSHNASTCGIHIHFNRDYFGEKEELCTARLLYLVEKFWEDIIIFSRRNRRKLKYCKKIDTSIPKYIKQWDKSNDHDGHYFALNLVNENTIEFRIFRGTLNIKTFMCIIDFMENLVKTAKTKTINEIQKMNFEELLTDRAKEYYLSRKSLLEFEE